MRGKKIEMLLLNLQEICLDIIGKKRSTFVLAIKTVPLEQITWITLF